LKESNLARVSVARFRLIIIKNCSFKTISKQRSEQFARGVSMHVLLQNLSQLWLRILTSPVFFLLQRVLLVILVQTRAKMCRHVRKGLSIARSSARMGSTVEHCILESILDVTGRERQEVY
jgi:hypothetical protein